MFRVEQDFQARGFSSWQRWIEVIFSKRVPLLEAHHHILFVYGIHEIRLSFQKSFIKAFYSFQKWIGGRTFLNSGMEN